MTVCSNPSSRGTRRAHASAMPGRLGTLAVLMALTGCMSLAPEHQTPQAPVADQFAGSHAGDTGTAMPVAAELPWR